jgi:hypothetical protein
MRPAGYPYRVSTLTTRRQRSRARRAGFAGGTDRIGGDPAAAVGASGHDRVATSPNWSGSLA